MALVEHVGARPHAPWATPWMTAISAFSQVRDGMLGGNPGHEVQRWRSLPNYDLIVRAESSIAPVSHIDTGTIKARVSMVRKLAGALDAKPDDLLTANERPPSVHSKGADT